MNEYDSSRMADMLNADNGMVETLTPEDADVILLNTCSVREKAEDKVFSHLGRFIPLKVANPNLVIGVGVVLRRKKVTTSSSARLMST